jgi:tetratricopeptide (TPR) repeat protein
MFSAKIAAAYASLGKLEEASRYYERALSVQDNPETHEELAVQLIRKGQPAEAESHLAHVAGETGKEQVGLLYFLTQAYGHTGSHVEALHILDRIETIDPLLAEDKEHAKLRTSILEAKSQGVPVLSASLGAPPGVMAEKPGVPLWLPQLVPVTLLVVALAVYLISAVVSGRSRHAWLVNGTGTVYDVVINGKRHSVRASSARPIQIAEGTITVQMDGTPLPIPAETHELRTPFFSRPFESPIVVISPDHQAVLVKEYTVYANTSVVDDMPPETFCGSGFYVFDDVDYPFRVFPNEIKIGSSSRRVRKSRLFRYEVGPDQSELDVVFQVIEPAQLEACLQRRVRLVPEDDIALHAYFSTGFSRAPDEVLEVLREGAAVRPPWIDWHRFYQECVSMVSPDYDLQGEYKGLLAAEPDSGILKYLLGRILNDPQEAEKLLLASEESGKATGRGYHAIAYRAVCLGQYAKGLEFSRKAMTANPERTQYRELYIRSSLATGEREPLLAWIRQRKARYPSGASLLALEGKVLAMQGRPDEANRIRDDFLRGMAENADDVQIGLWRSFLSAPVHYVQGQLPEYLAAMRRSENIAAELQAAFCASNLTAISGMLEENNAVSMHLLACCMALAQGHADQAEHFRARAQEILGQGNADAQAAARMLDPENGPPGGSNLETLQILPDQKCILAVVLGFTHPCSRELCFRVARSHNYDCVFPYHLIAKWIGEG